jgi:hypothetical protein
MQGRGPIVLVVLALALSSLGCVCCGLDFGTVRLGEVGAVRGSGGVVEQVREVSDFTGVELAGVGDLTIQMGDEESLRIEAEDNLLEYIETEVRGGTLRIQTRPGVTLRSQRSIRYYLTARELDRIVISGSGDVEAPDLQAGRFSITISGSGDLAMGELEADALSVKISGSGDVDMDDLRSRTLEVSILGSGNLAIGGGQVEKQTITINGSGDYQARGLESAEAQVTIPGSGAVTLQVHDYLKVVISGSGDVRYVGSPRVDKSVSGSGNVRQVGD